MDLVNLQHTWYVLNFIPVSFETVSAVPSVETTGRSFFLKNVVCKILRRMKL